MCSFLPVSSRLHQIYCCTGFLSLTGQLHRLNADLLGWWLCERQLPSGGLNGRPEKVGFIRTDRHVCSRDSTTCIFTFLHI